MERRAFLDRLQQSDLLSRADLEQAASHFPDDAPTQDIADALVEQGLLTPYQVRQVCGGDTQRLSLGQYRILDELGRGGMGQVYKALHTIMGRVVAIKVISPELVQNPLAVEWFRREVRATTQLQHPNIVMAYDANEADGLHFLVMEYVEGVNLDALVKRQGPLPVAAASTLMRQTALALQYAHDKGMVHRDIKPGNLLIVLPTQPSPPGGEGRVRGDEPVVKVVDFGLARLHNAAKADTIALRTEAGVLGTPDYIAPEQARDVHAADIRSDLYSLGCTFYYALTGRVPFPGENAMEKLIKHLMDEPTPLEELRPEVPPELAALVRRLMAKKPEDRYPTPAEFIRQLDGCCATWTRSALGVLSRLLPASDPPAAPDKGPGTRMLSRVAVFAPVAVAEPSGPSLLEPLWKQPPGAPAPTSRDTMTGTPAADTELTTASLSGAACGLAVSAKPQAAPAGPARLAGPTAHAPRRIAPAVRRAWRRWTTVVEALAAGRRPGVNAETYRALHAELLQCCRNAADAADTAEWRAAYQRLASVVQPWFNLQTFARTEANMIEALLLRCREMELELNCGKSLWTARKCLGLVLLLLSPIGLALWYWHSGGLWLPSLYQSFRWGPSASPSTESVWAFIEAHPSLLMGVVFPVVILFSIYLLTRSTRV